MFLLVRRGDNHGNNAPIMDCHPQVGLIGN